MKTPSSIGKRLAGAEAHLLLTRNPRRVSIGPCYVDCLGVAAGVPVPSDVDPGSVCAGPKANGASKGRDSRRRASPSAVLGCASTAICHVQAGNIP
jgi:hypothetical protein